MNLKKKSESEVSFGQHRKNTHTQTLFKKLENSEDEFQSKQILEQNINQV